MLAREHRMVDPADFRRAIREGSRAGDPMVVVHCRTDEERDTRLVGFVVPKREIKRAVGRNRVKRQFRHLMRQRIDTIPEGGRVVIRVGARALGASSEELAAHLDRTMRRAWKKWEAR
ncbi:ribonuclease P protein component [Actinomyces sp. B33]|uniref:ribonuclease P protein component n=1 Tax=Actinomyces sp. B33 TaxID=2942131 RepID=UPI002341492A|nr:ribonuclease P protein component [Actinomyces sp. B33]MDC4232543.1 ribonuclease P protein component [Actinomyces sp. B33]